MVLAKDVLGLKRLNIADGKAVEQPRNRRRQDELDGDLVHRLDLYRLALKHPQARRFLKDLRVHNQIVEPEIHIGRGKRLAVRPTMPLAQDKGELGKVLIPLPTFSHVGHDSLQVVAITHKIHMPQAQYIRGSRLSGIRQTI